ncbi:hypothetical protein QCA50_013772 [Cerrena zonata]|uniref:Mixed lineage kinase domain-containing protein n=1 Tax=Cerrena zonata TaxID=2478898 RepID=A0AAW0FU49_9APHY
MPPTKPSSTTSQALNAAIVASTLAKEIGDLFPPAAAAAGVLLLILNTIKHLKTDQIECYRLAQRCLELLTQIKEQTEGRSDVPSSLTKNLEKFERTLECIHTQMKTFTERSWKSRLMKKGDIERSIEDLNALLDETATSFQIATLINIHYAIGDRTPMASLSSEGSSSTLVNFSSRQGTSSSGQSVPQSVLVGSIDERGLLIETRDSALSTDLNASPIGGSFDVLSDIDSRPVTPHDYGFQRTQSPIDSIGPDSSDSHDGSSSDEDDSLSDVMEDPFVDSVSSTRAPSMDALTVKDPLETESGAPAPAWREYHQSDIVLQGRSKIKDGWWGGSSEVSVYGRTVIVKRYVGDHSKKLWYRDLEILKTIQHRHLPTLVGFSTEDSSTRFILLAETGTKALRIFLRDESKQRDISTMSTVLLQLYQETLEVAHYVQEQLNLSDSKTQDYIEQASFRVTTDQQILLGLPSTELDDTISCRQWTLKESIRDVFIAALPDKCLEDSFLAMVNAS